MIDSNFCFSAVNFLILSLLWYTRNLWFFFTGTTILQFYFIVGIRMLQSPHRVYSSLSWTTLFMQPCMGITFWWQWDFAPSGSIQWSLLAFRSLKWLSVWLLPFLDSITTGQMRSAKLKKKTTLQPLSCMEAISFCSYNSSLAVISNQKSLRKSKNQYNSISNLLTIDNLEGFLLLFGFWSFQCKWYVVHMYIISRERPKTLSGLPVTILRTADSTQSRTRHKIFTIERFYYGGFHRLAKNRL